MKAAMNGIPNLAFSTDGGLKGITALTAGQLVRRNRLILLLKKTTLMPMPFTSCWKMRSCHCTTRDRDGIPRGWVEVMRESIRSVSPQFSMTRMLKDYTRAALYQCAPVAELSHAD